MCLLCKSFSHVVCCFSGYSGPSSCHPHFTVNFSKMQEWFLKNENLCVDRTCNPHAILPLVQTSLLLFHEMSTLNPNCRLLSSSPLPIWPYLWTCLSQSGSPWLFQPVPSPTVIPVWRANRSDSKSLEAVISAESVKSSPSPSPLGSCVWHRHPDSCSLKLQSFVPLPSGWHTGWAEFPLCSQQQTLA